MKNKEKCCADCKHCIRHDISDYECGKTGVRNRITGRYEYKECRDVIDTTDCEFKDETTRRIVICVITIVIGLVASFFIGWNML